MLHILYTRRHRDLRYGTSPHGLASTVQVLRLNYRRTIGFLLGGRRFAEDLTPLQWRKCYLAPVRHERDVLLPGEGVRPEYWYKDHESHAENRRLPSRSVPKLEGVRYDGGPKPTYGPDEEHVWQGVIDGEWKKTDPSILDSVEIFHL